MLRTTANVMLGTMERGNLQGIYDVFQLDHNYCSLSPIRNNSLFKLFSYLHLSDEVPSVDVNTFPFIHLLYPKYP